MSCEYKCSRCGVKHSDIAGSANMIYGILDGRGYIIVRPGGYDVKLCPSCADKFEEFMGELGRCEEKIDD